MNNEKLKAISSLIEKDDIVLDIGCDHGYLDILLKKNNLCKEVYASDISSNALNYAINNFKKYDVSIKTFVSDGFKDVIESYNTAVIAGMGTSTIIDILNYKKLPNKLIISSNNEHYKLRKHLNDLGYTLDKELVVYENNHYYVIMKYIKGSEILTEEELLYGKNNNYEYLNYLLNKKNEILKKAGKKDCLLKEIEVLKGLIEKM